MADDFITSGEFGRFRVDFNARIADLGNQMNGRFDRVDESFADLNGRTRKQAEAIVALDGRVTQIAEGGCGKYEEHRGVLAALAGEGMSKRTQIGIAAGSGAGLIGVIEILRAAAQHFWK